MEVVDKVYKTEMMKGGRPSLICKRGARGTALFGKLLVLAPQSHSIKSAAASISDRYFFSLTHISESAATRSTNSELQMQQVTLSSTLAHNKECN